MRTKALLTAHALLASIAFVAADANADAPKLDDYRHYRALSVDLVGRLPTRAELAAFEAPGFNLDAWVDAHLQGPAYADRVARVYMELLRLQLSSVFNVTQNVTGLRRETIVGPDGTPMYVYFRFGQRRTRPETDGDFCMTADETGLQFPGLGQPVPFPANSGRTTGTPVTQAALDASTVLVHPWWLYRDYKSATPTDRYDKVTWATTHPGFAPYAGLQMEPDGKTPTTQIRVCKEEALGGAETGHVYASGRTTKLTADGGGPPFNRLNFPPVDDAYATAHANEAISCRTSTGFSHALDCGCGAGLEHCWAGAGVNPEASPALIMPTFNVLGADTPVDATAQAGSAWVRLWWAEEARHFLQYVVGGDHDFREVVTAPYTFVNGPLAEFYKGEAPASCCGPGINLGYLEPDPLFNPSAVPSDLLPHDVTSWETVPNRGPHASGILTMPIFLTKFGTRRSKAHVLTNAFLCKDFIAPANLQLTPSTDPNLMSRSGCSSCHATLEPMAAYFSRIVESDWTFLPPDKFPTDTSQGCGGAGPQPLHCACHTDAKGALNGTCATYYDVAFSDPKHATLRGAYPDAVNNSTTRHADLGPQGMATELTQSPDFPGCVAQNVAQSFLGRPLTPEDAALRQTLTDALTANGFRMRALVRAMVLSDVYRHSNNLSSSAWRKGAAK